MNTFRAFIITIIAAFSMSMTAHAAGPDVGAQFCGQVRDQANPPTQGCFTIEEADEYKGAFASAQMLGYIDPATGRLGSSPTKAGCGGPPYTCQAASYYGLTRTYARRHPFNALVWRTMNITWYSADGASVAPINLISASAADDSRLNVPDCPYMMEGKLVGGFPGLLDDAALLQSVCGLTKPEPPTTTVAPSTTTAPLRRCAAFKHGRKNVAVTSRGVACAPARNMLAKFVRRNVEPTGYTCLKLRLGRQVAAKCTKNGVARAKALPIAVEGRWRV